MISKPCQIGEWWVMPADRYTGKIPSNIQDKWDSFKASHPEVVGYLITEDMREVIERQKKEAEEQKKKEAQARLAARQEELKAIELQRKAREAELRLQEENRRREITRQEEQRRQREEKQWRSQSDFDAGKTLKVVGSIVAAVAGIALIAATGGAVLILGAIGTALVYDPMLIAVMPDGRWVCLGAWWD
jgi:hypothetical protein